jgi:hypothetical protein
MSFDTVSKFERVDSHVAKIIQLQGKYIIDKPIDITAGGGFIDKDTRCVWTVAGKRVTVSMSHGSLILTQSKEIDPLYQTRKGTF